jgi:hypothetical protein
VFIRSRDEQSRLVTLKRGKNHDHVKKQTVIVAGIRLHAFVVFLSGLLLGGVLEAQDLPVSAPMGVLAGSAGPGLCELRCPSSNFPK